MPVDITVPQLGESVVEATVGAWRKRTGERVDEGEVVVELETDKVNLEVAAPQAGVLGAIAHGEGDTVAVGDVLATVEEATASSATPARAAPPQEAHATAPSPSTQTPEGGPRDGARASTPADTPLADGIHATPLARRIAAEHGLDLRTVHGSGPAGRISHDDVNAVLAQVRPVQTQQVQAQTTPSVKPAPAGGNGVTAAPATTVGTSSGRPQPPATVAPAPSPAPASALPSPQRGGAGGEVSDRREERVRLSRRRQTIARRLVEAQHTAAMLTTFNEVDMSAIMELRKRRRDAFKERHGVGLGYMSFFTRAVIGALKAYPRLNAEIQGDEMVLKRYFDIGIAVSTDEGLVVPVVRDADRLTFAEIERQIASLAERARNRTLTLEELQGGTFTITNGGIFGSLLSTPILNGPQVGILGMHKIEERPIALNGQVVIRPMMYLAVSYDHRIVDGAESVSFLVRVKELLEDPESLLLEG